MSKEHLHRKPLVVRHGQSRAETPRTFWDTHVQTGMYIPDEREIFSRQELIMRPIDFPRREFEALKTLSFETKIPRHQLSAGFLADHATVLEGKESREQDEVLLGMEERFSDRLQKEEEMLRQGLKREEIYVAQGFYIPKRVNAAIIGFAHRVVELTRNSLFQPKDYIIDVLSY